MNKPGECQRCGKCCKLFVFTGVQLTDEECIELEKNIKNFKKPDLEIIKRLKTLPIVGDKPPKKCTLLEGENDCGIYSKRPQRCREYPVIVQPGKRYFSINISQDCPRGIYLYNQFKKEIPEYIKKKSLGKEIKLRFTSFFEMSMNRFLDEEE